MTWNLEDVLFESWWSDHEDEVGPRGGPVNGAVVKETARQVWTAAFRKHRADQERWREHELLYYRALEDIGDAIERIHKEYGFPVEDFSVDGMASIHRHIGQLIAELRELRKRASDDSSEISRLRERVLTLEASQREEKRPGGR